MNSRITSIAERGAAVCPAIIIALSAYLYLANVGDRALWSEEVRWAQIPREMQQSGDYFHPTMNGHTYYDKPLGSYWLVLAAAGNRDVNELAARLPSAIAGLVSVVLVLMIARQLLNAVTAFFSGAVFATSFSIVFFSRTASADMENVAGILAALWLYLRWEDKPAGSTTIAFWLVMAVTSLTKGLLGLAIPLLVVAVYRSFGPLNWHDLFARQRWLLNRWTLLAAPMGVALFLTPFYVSYSRTASNDGLTMVFRENLRRFFDPVNHRGPVWLYVAAIFPLLAPWSALLPAALWHAHSLWKYDDQRRRFPLIYFWSTFIFYTLSASRRSYYLLPVLPAAAILIARLLADPKECQSVAVRRLKIAGAIAVIIAIVVAGLAAAIPANWRPEPWNQLPNFQPDGRLIAEIVLVLGLTTFCRIGLKRSKTDPALLGFSMMFVGGIVMFFVFHLALPEVEAYRTRKPFAEGVRTQLNGDFRGLGLYRHREVVYYLASNEPIPEFDSVESLKKAVTGGDIQKLIVRQQDIQGLSLSSRIVVQEKWWPWESEEQRRAKLVLIEFDSDQEK
jgi:4-amino-4-deoxy-L-arabinose transferase-like glycosyltransferase